MFSKLLNSPARAEWLKNGLTLIYGFVAVMLVSPAWPLLVDDARTYGAIMVCVLLSLVGFRFLIGRVVHYGNDPLNKIGL